jgi:hypothetical protein
MKKTFLIAGAVLLLPALALAQELSLGLEIIGSTGLGTADPKIAIINLIRVLMGFLGIIAVAIILLGGFKWMTAQGDDKKIEAAKKLITAGLTGLVIVLAAFLIANFVISTIGTQIQGAA